MEKKDAKQEDVMDKRSEYDHESGVLNEPKPEDDPKTYRHQVDPVRDPALVDQENNPVPRRGDPFAHQRDEKAAKAGHKEEVAKEEKAEKNKK